MRLLPVAGLALHVDDDMGHARQVGAVGCRHVGAATVMKGAVAGFERHRHPWREFQLGADRKQRPRIVQVLDRQIGLAVRAGEKRHASALDRDVAQGDPGRDGVGAVAMGPVGLVLVELGGSLVVRHLAEDVVMKQPQVGAGEALGRRRHVRMKREPSHVVVASPDVDDLNEDVDVVDLPVVRRRHVGPDAVDQARAGFEVMRRLVGGDDAGDADETVTFVRGLHRGRDLGCHHVPDSVFSAARSASR